MRWDGILQVGVLRCLLYLFDGIGLAARNKELLHEVAAFLRACDMPFIIGGDWNLAPDVLGASGC